MTQEMLDKFAEYSALQYENMRALAAEQWAAQNDLVMNPGDYPSDTRPTEVVGPLAAQALSDYIGLWTAYQQSLVEGS